MRIEIKKETHKGITYISISKIIGDVWKERGFELKDDLSVEQIIELINQNLSKLLND